jgi:hypothetical protein
MAGSRVIRQYTDDAGNQYAITIDESNAEAIVGGGSTVLMPLRTSNIEGLPRGLTPRYVLAYLATNPLVRRKFKVGGVAQINALIQPGATITAAVTANPDDLGPGPGATFVITAYRGEKRNLIPATNAAGDTGLIDGDEN